MSSHVAYLLSTKCAHAFGSFNKRLIWYCGKSINRLLQKSSVENINDSISCFRTVNSVCRFNFTIESYEWQSFNNYKICLSSWKFSSSVIPSNFHSGTLSRVISSHFTLFFFFKLVILWHLWSWYDHNFCFCTVENNVNHCI